MVLGTAGHAPSRRRVRTSGRANLETTLRPVKVLRYPNSCSNRAVCYANSPTRSAPSVRPWEFPFSAICSSRSCIEADAPAAQGEVVTRSRKRTSAAILRQKARAPAVLWCQKLLHVTKRLSKEGIFVQIPWAHCNKTNRLQCCQYHTLIRVLPDTKGLPPVCFRPRMPTRSQSVLENLSPRRLMRDGFTVNRKTKGPRGSCRLAALNSECCRGMDRIQSKSER